VNAVMASGITAAKNLAKGISQNVGTKKTISIKSTELKIIKAAFHLKIYGL